MITWLELKAKFPKEIYIHISEYNNQHRINNSKLLDELLDETKIVYCGNRDCDEHFEKYWMINRTLYNYEYYVCSTYCIGECEDNIRDYLKAMYYRKQKEKKKFDEIDIN